MDNEIKQAKQKLVDLQKEVMEQEKYDVDVINLLITDQADLEDLHDLDLNKYLSDEDMENSEINVKRVSQE